MQHWNGATLAQASAEVSTTNIVQLGSFAVFTKQMAMILTFGVQDKMHLYRLRLVVTLVMNPANNARDTVMKACRL